MASVRFTWKRAVINQVTRAARKGLFNVGKEIFNESEKIVPLDDGELSLGGRLSSENDTVIVSYGNNDVSAQYAVIQHENLAYNHTPPTQAKYLETPFMDILDGYEEIIKYTMRGEVNL